MRWPRRPVAPATNTVGGVVEREAEVEEGRAEVMSGVMKAARCAILVGRFAGARAGAGGRWGDGCVGRAIA